GMEQRRPLGDPADAVRVGPALEEELDRIEAPGAGRERERGDHETATGVGIGAGVEKGLHRGEIAAGRRAAQGGAVQGAAEGERGRKAEGEERSNLHGRSSGPEYTANYFVMQSLE